MTDRPDTLTGAWRELADAVRDLFGDVRREIARTLDPDTQRTAARLAVARAQVSHALEGNAAALRRLDDLAVRILGATLAIGRVGRIEVKPLTVAVGSPDHHRDAYDADDVNALLEAAREALLEAEDVARYATLARRQAVQTLGHTDGAIAAHSLYGTLKRAHAILSVPTGPPWSPDQLLEAIIHAEDLIAGALAAPDPDPPTTDPMEEPDPMGGPEDLGGGETEREPRLGYARTGELLEEVLVRVEVDGKAGELPSGRASYVASLLRSARRLLGEDGRLDYRTVDGR